MAICRGESTSIDLWSIYEKSNSESTNKMKNKNGEKAKYIYAKIMFF